MEGLMKEGINRGIFHSHTKDIKRADFGDPIQGLAPLYLTKMDLAKKSVAEALQARLSLRSFISYYFIHRTFLCVFVFVLQ